VIGVLDMALRMRTFSPRRSRYHSCTRLDPCVEIPVVHSVVYRSSYSTIIDLYRHLGCVRTAT